MPFFWKSRSNVEGENLVKKMEQSSTGADDKETEDGIQTGRWLSRGGLLGRDAGKRGSECFWRVFRRERCWRMWLETLVGVAGGAVEYGGQVVVLLTFAGRIEIVV